MAVLQCFTSRQGNCGAVELPDIGLLVSVKLGHVGRGLPMCIGTQALLLAGPIAFNDHIQGLRPVATEYSAVGTKIYLSIVPLVQRDLCAEALEPR